jgi:SAM-dependent methyltransferase
MGHSPCNTPTSAKDNVEFYEAFAPYYERVYSCIDAVETVRQWVLLLEQLEFHSNRQEPGKVPQKVVDVGCGPGWHLVPWVNAGFGVSGLDSSPTMLKFAEKNVAAALLEKHCSLHLADIRKPRQLARLRDSFDLAVSHFNFLDLFAPDELEAVFQGVHSIVRPGGLWVADYSSPRRPLPSVCETYDCGKARGLLTKESRLSSGKEVYELHWLSEGVDICEAYWFHTTEHCDTAARGAGWNPVGYFEWLPHRLTCPWQPMTPESERLVVLLRRA